MLRSAVHCFPEAAREEDSMIKIGDFFQVALVSDQSVRPL